MVTGDMDATAWRFPAPGSMDSIPCMGAESHGLRHGEQEEKVVMGWRLHLFHSGITGS